MTDAPRPIVNVHEAEGFPMAPAGGSATSGATLAPPGFRIGAGKLGAMLTTVGPGERPLPFHASHADEETFFVLEGAGGTRSGAATLPIPAGDLIARRPGGAEAARRVPDTGTETPEFLSSPTTIEPDAVACPVIGKHSALPIGSGRDFSGARARHVFRQDDGRDCWGDEA